MLGPDINATFVTGDPPRLGALALWPVRTPRRTTVNLVVPRGDGVAQCEVEASLVPVASILDDLLAVGTDSPVSRSVHAWATVARVAVGLIARGRIRPGASGHLDAWRLGPLDGEDLTVRVALAGWLPPEAHCIVRHGHEPARIMAPTVAIAEFSDAVADLIPRTAGAALLTRFHAFAGSEAIPQPDIAALIPAERADRAVLGVRLLLPEGGEDPFRIQLQVRSALDPAQIADAAELWDGTASGFGPDAEADLLVALRRGARIWPPFAELLEEATPSEIALRDDHALDLLGPLANHLGSAGIEVLVPVTATRSIRPTAHVEPPPGAGDGPSRFDLTTLCQLTYRPTLDGEPLTPAELSALAASSRPLVRLRDEWVLVDPSLVAKMSRSRSISTGDAIAAALSGELRLDGETLSVEAAPRLDALVERLRLAAAPHEHEAPAALATELRPYQRRGLGWLSEMAGLGLGGVLADDMGLGKTVQLIALALARRDAGDPFPTLVVCPASVVPNWEHELARFAPDLEVRRYHGPDRSLEGVAGPIVVVTTYGIVRRDQEALGEIPWGLIAADEAQHIKNPNASVSKGLRSLSADARVALTGTPVENRLTELWALLDWTTPGLLGSVERFRREIAIPIERNGDPATLARFSRLVAPFVLRRRKSDPDVAPDLPPKIETDHLVTLSSEQASLYRAVVEESLARIESADGIERRGLVFKMLTALKQICNHPAHYLGRPGPLSGRSGKLDATDELLEAIVDAGDAALVFTQYVQMGNLLTARLDELGLESEFLHGSLSIAARSQMVERFQAGGFPIFVISLKAGGTGLNLTRANHVLHYDRWWNPAVESQASDRAWRIGQDRTVQIHRPISEGTVEERIAQVLAEKAALAEAVIGSGEAWISELDDAELTALVQLGGA